MVDANAITAGTEEVIWAVTGDRRIRLLGWSLSVSAAAALEFQDSATSGTVIIQSPLLASAGIHDSPDLGDGVLLASGSDLSLDVSANATVSGTVWGVEEGAGY